MDIGRGHAEALHESTRPRTVAPTPPRSLLQPTKENDLRSSEATITLGRTRHSLTAHPPVVPRRCTADPTTTTTPQGQHIATPFSCRRWRRLTGALPETRTSHSNHTSPIVTTLAHPSSHGSSPPRASNDTIFTTRTSRLSKPPPPTTHGRPMVPWQELNHIDSRVRKKLVDKAYGITASHQTAHQFPLQYGTKAAQRQFIHTQIYLPSVHRTLNYLEKTHDFITPSPRDHCSARPLLRPAPIGTKLLSSQLQALQAELLTHYESERTSPTSSDHLRRPHPPKSSPISSSSPSCVTVAEPLLPPSRNLSSAGSFRSQRLTRTPREGSASAADRSEEEVEAEAEADDVTMLTDADACSLSRDADADCEKDTRTPPPHASLSLSSSGTASWASLESHVLLALEGSEAAQIGSVREPLVVIYDSDDSLGLCTDSSSQPSFGALSGIASEKYLTEISGVEGGYAPEDGAKEVGGDHVVFVDNGVRVNAAGEMLAMEMEEVDAWTLGRTESLEESPLPTQEVGVSADVLGEKLEETSPQDSTSSWKKLARCQEEEARACHAAERNDAVTVPSEEKTAKHNGHASSMDSQGIDDLRCDAPFEQATCFLASSPLASGNSSPIASSSSPNRTPDCPVEIEYLLIERELLQRTNVATTVGYDDADFEKKVEVNDTGSVDGYESFED